MDKLRGKEFRNWDHFRRSFWKEVAKDPVLSKVFDPDDIRVMKTFGRAPSAAQTQRVGGQIKYILHHINPLHNGGRVYDIDNLLLVTPGHHKEILPPNFHFDRN